jgi:putative ABC transport system substrate-binding protein
MGPVSALDRRAFVQHLAWLGASAAGLLLNSCGLLPSAVKTAKIVCVGFLGEQPDTPWAAALWDRLGELGWVEGQTLTVERRYSPAGELPTLVSELLAVGVDLLVTVGTPATSAAKQATHTLPIVFMNVRDPVGVGVVTSLARPGGNVTGVSQGASTSTNGKQLELLKAVVPGLVHVAVMVDPNNPAANALNLAQIQDAAGVLGAQVQALYVGSADDLANVFAMAAGWPAHGVIVRESSITLGLRTRIADLAARSHLPAMYSANEFVEVGGLMSYGSPQRSTYQRAASYVDKILRGAKPADLPVEQLTTLEFAINVKAAQALGLTLPPDVAAQVTEWVAAP